MFRRRFSTRPLSHVKRNKHRIIETLELRQMMAGDMPAALQDLEAQVKVPLSEINQVSTAAAAMASDGLIQTNGDMVKAGKVDASPMDAAHTMQANVAASAQTPAPSNPVQTIDEIAAELEGELNKSIEQLEDEIATWNKWREGKTAEAQKTADKAIDGLTKKIGEATREIKSLRKEIEKAEDAIDRRKQKIKDIRNEIHDWKDEIDGWRDKIDDLADKLGRFAPSWIKKDINKLKDKVRGAEDKIDAAARKIDSLADEIDEIVSEIKGLKKAITKQEQLIDKFEAQINDARKQLKSTVNNLRTKADNAIRTVHTKIETMRKNAMEFISQLREQGMAFFEQLQRIADNFGSISDGVIESFRQLSPEAQEKALKFISDNGDNVPQNGDAVARFKSWWNDKVKEPLRNGGMLKDLTTFFLQSIDIPLTVNKGLVADYIRGITDFADRVVDARNLMQAGKEDQAIGTLIKAHAYLYNDLYSAAPAAWVMHFANAYGVLRGAIWGRPLNAQEVEFAKQIFGSKIDFSRVRLVENAGEMKSGAGMVLGGTIMIHGQSMHDADGRALFAHELTHVYQNQRNPGYRTTNTAAKELFTDITTPGPDHRYDVNLSSNSKWDKLGIEEQGEVVQDYLYHLEKVKDRELSDTELKNYERVLKQAGLFDGLRGSDRSSYPYALTAAKSDVAATPGPSNQAVVQFLVQDSAVAALSYVDLQPWSRNLAAIVP